MPFLFLGLFLLVTGIVFNVRARKDGDGDGVVGTTGIIIAGIILILIFGLFFRTVALTN